MSLQPAGILALIALATLILALVSCLVFSVVSLERRHKRRRTRHTAQGARSRSLKGGALTYARLSARRGGFRSLVPVLAGVCAAVLFCQLTGTVTRYDQQLMKLRSDSSVRGFLTDIRGQSTSGLALGDGVVEGISQIPGVADVAGVVGSRMKYALVAAAAATVWFALFGGSGSAINAAEAEAILAQYSNPKGLIMLIPVAILLIVAFIKRNIYVACPWGLISGTIIGLVSGILVPSDIMGMQDGTLGGFLIDGVNNMIGTVGYLYAIAGIIGILSASGLLQQVIDGLVHSKLNRSVVGTEVIISVGLMVSSICLGSANGPAIIMWGPIANDLGESKGLHPYRRANLMDGFGSTLPAVIPVTSAFIFIALSCIQGLMDTYSFVQEVSPVSLAGASLHCWFLFVVLAVAVITGWGRKYEGPNGEPVKALPAQTK